MHCISAKQLLLWKNQQLSKGGDNESLSLLLEAKGGISSRELSFLNLDPKKNLLLNEKLSLIESIWDKHLLSSTPIQYLCGFTFWRDLKLEVTEKVLIPRPETEILVDIVLKLFNKNFKKLFFAELGTGSGAVSISLSLVNSSWNGIATDIDQNALDIAEKNFMSSSNKSNLKFCCGNWWTPLEKYKGEFDFVISNPPYIPKEIYKKLPREVKNFEPEVALVGGEDGLRHIRQIIKFAPQFLKEKGWLILENHFDQGVKVRQLFLENKFKFVEVINDYSGIGRFTIGRWK